MVSRIPTVVPSSLERGTGRVCKASGTRRARLYLGAIVASIRKCQRVRDTHRHEDRERCMHIHVDSSVTELLRLHTGHSSEISHNTT